MCLTWNHWQTWFRLVPPAPCRKSYGPSTRIAYAFFTRDEYLGKGGGGGGGVFKFGIFEVKIRHKPWLGDIGAACPMPQELRPFNSYCLCIPHRGWVLRKLVWNKQRQSLSLGTLKSKSDTNPSDLVMVFLVDPSSFIHSLLVSCVFPSTEWPHFHLPATLHPRAVVGSVCWGRGGGYNTCLSHPHPCLMIFVASHVEAFPGLVRTGSFRYLPVKPSPYTVGENS